MPFAAGTFTLVAGNPVTTNTTISSIWANTTLADIASGLTSCVLKDGTQTITANMPMAGFKFTGLGPGSSANDSVRYNQVLLLTGGTMTGNLLFTDNTYDIGATGATRPRDLWLARNANVSGTLTVGGAVLLTGTLTVGGVTSTGATGTGNIVFSNAPTVVSPVINTSVSGTAIATQAQQETATAVEVLVTPGRQVFHPGHPKAWGNIAMVSGTPTLDASYNITSIADTDVGRITVTIATDFSSTNYAVTGMIDINTPSGVAMSVKALASGSFELNFAITSTPSDAYDGANFICCGDQP